VRTALAVGAVLLLVGCGGNVDERPAATGPPIVATEPPPPITAIDEPAPELVEWSLNAMFSEPITDDDKNENTKAADITVDCATSTSIGGSTEDESEETTADCPPPLTAEQSEELRQMQKTWRAALSPAPGTHPRSIAELPLTTGGRAVFVTWRNSAGELCTETETETDGGGGGGSPSGPCLSAGFGLECGQMCVASSGSGGAEGLQYLLTGLVPAGGEAARVKLAGGAIRTFPLTGPVIPGSGFRALMIELGRRDWRSLELIENGRVTERTEMPAAQAAMEDCMDETPGVGDEADDVWDQRVTACLRSKIPVGSLDGSSFGVRIPAVPVESSP
jgi:hypothetical protein